MTEFIQIAMLVCYCIIFVFGLPLNAMTMYVLVRDKELRKQLAPVRWLMFGDAFCEFVVCLIAVPLMAGSVMIGNAPPYSTVPILCHLVVLCGYGAGVVSFWYQGAIAMTRFAAVMTPNFYRLYARNRITNAVLIVFPWVFAYTSYIVCAAARIYYIRPVGGTGSCEADQYDDSPRTAEMYATYLLIDTITNEWGGMIVGLFCYAAIYLHMFWLNLVKKKQNHIQQQTANVDPSSNTAAGANTNNNDIPLQSRKSTKPDVTNNHHRRRGSTTTTPSHPPTAPHTVATAAAVPLHDRLHKERERDKKIKMLFIAFIVNLVVLLPINATYGLNYYSYVVDNYPVVARILDMSWFSIFPLNPLLYALVSDDFRQAYRRCFARKY